MANLSLPLAIPAHGYAKNSSLRVNFDFIVSELNSIVGGSSAFDSITIGTASTTTGTIVMYNSASVYSTTIQAGAAGANQTFTLPTTTGTSNYALVTNGSGVLSWSYVFRASGTGLTDNGTGTVSLTTPVATTNGGTGQSSYGDGDLLIGNGSSGSLSKAGLTGTSNQIIVTNGHGSITLSTPQNINTNSTPTFASLTLTATTNQLVLGTTRTVTISATQPATSSRVYTIPDQGAAANIVADQANYTISGTWTFNNDTTLAAGKKIIFTGSSSGTVAIKGGSSITSYTITLPTTAGANNNVLVTDGTGVTSWIGAGTLVGSVSSGTAGNLGIYPSTGTNIADSWTQNSQLIHVSLATHPTLGSTRTYTVPDAGENTTFAMASTFFGGRNRILNGEFIFDQENEGAAVSLNVSLVYIVDGWKAERQINTGTLQSVRSTSSPPAGFTAYLNMGAGTGVTATSQSDVQALIEGYDVIDLLFGGANAAIVTLSFWVQSSLTGTFGGAIQNSAQDRSYVFSYVINSANTWEYKTVTLTGDTTGTWLVGSNIGIRVLFSMGDGGGNLNTAGSWYSGRYNGVTSQVNLIEHTNATWYLTGVQFERGGVATPFEHLTQERGLQRCQRYYEKSYDLGSAVGSSSASFQFATTASQVGASAVRSGWLPFHVTKRTDPSITLYTGTGTSGKWNWISTGGVATARTTTTAEIETNGFNMGQSAALDFYANGHWVADARL